MDTEDTLGVEIQHRPGIGAALDLLKEELVLLQEQDVLLLKQLMNIHYSIRMLKRKLTHRTNSFSNLINLKSPYFTPPPVSRTLATHASLSRVMSEPSRFLIQQRSLSIPTEDEEEEEEDELTNSFNSSGSELLEPLQQSLNLDPETSSLLADMPVSLRRKYLSSLTQNNNTSFTARSRTINKPLNSVSDAKFKLTSCGGTESINNSSSNRNVGSSENREHLKEEVFNYDSESALGIEITAL